jgi:hypothetical protein
MQGTMYATKQSSATNATTAAKANPPLPLKVSTRSLSDICLPAAYRVAALNLTRSAASVDLSESRDEVSPARVSQIPPVPPRS